MKRRSDRGKSKSEQPKEDTAEKAPRKSHRHSRRRKKSSSSSEDVENTVVIQDIPQPEEMQVKDIELPQGEQSQPVVAIDKTDKSGEEPKVESEAEGGTSTKEPEENLKEKEESSLWKVQSANGAGGEIQKLKICRQRPTGSPETGESSPQKRLSRGIKDGRSTDDSTHDESERDTKKSKHKSRSSRNSPLVSPTVVCDLSENSPTKIKIINVGNINTGNTPRSDSVGDVKDETQKAIEIQEDSQMSDTLDIALPTDEPPPNKQSEVTEVKNMAIVPDDNLINNKTGSNEDLTKNQNEISNSKRDTKEFPPKKSTSASPSPKNETLKSHTSGSSSADSDASQDESKPRKKKRKRELQSTVQRKKSSSASPKRESSDSEEDGKKKKDEADRRRSPKIEENNDSLNNKVDEVQPPPTSIKENKPEETNGIEGFEQQRSIPRKRRWGSSSYSKSGKKQILNISSEFLKSLLPDAKPVPLEELQLSLEEEEGQLDDDDEEEDEVVVMVTKEEEIQLEREKEIEEKQKEKEKELEDKRKRQERFEKKIKREHSPEQTKVENPRKIHLITEDTKKSAHSQSPPRRKPTDVLYITHLVRPFTVQQLKNLLLRTGQIAENGFWIDNIKSKCYVQYTTEDAAVETRHALHGVRWPTSNPKTLVVEFASHDDMLVAQALSEEPDVPRKAEPLNMVEGWVADQARIKERSRRTVVREWDVGKPEHPDEMLDQELKMKERKEQERRSRKERPHRSISPEAEAPNRKARRKEEDAPAKLLDDLFRKTKTSPCIYWLPLTQEQISVKEEMRRQHMAEHERRMAELKKVELARRDKDKRSRK